MPIFKKEEDYIDLTDLQKRGIQIKKDPVELQRENEFVDLSQPQPSAESLNPLAFLDSLASSSPPAPPTPQPTQSPDTQDLKIQIENFEYKLDRLTEKLATIESKLSAFEEKVK